MKKYMLEEGFRWYGPKDEVSLEFIRQAGAESVFTSLHDIPYGEVWSVEAILAHKKIVEDAGLKWSAVESVPVSEDIKTRTGDYVRHIENYKQTIRNLAECGIKIIIYNFMPVLDWIRTDLHYKLADGSTCLRFDPAQFAAFEIYLLKRQGAEKDYTPEQLQRAKAFFDALDTDGVKKFERSIIDVFPGCSMDFSIDDVRNMLAKYANIDANKLREHLALFLKEVAPVAEECNSHLAIHPDDPPFDVLGLPRIASRLEDFQKIVSAYDSPANSVCFCTGSLSAGAHNNIPEMLEALKDRVFVAHLRSTQRNSDGSFFEAGHLEGSVPMCDVVKKLLQIQKQRIDNGGEKIVIRPDHGRDMADDLSKPPTRNPGYSFIGRMKGLAELRGLETGILSK
ncbi:MAG: mannonate dehydratase [Verrucomicrobiaceae bacterium]|nr:mannonate dehydratase [Verrucomicrobiaceae bacterium]